MESNKLHPRVRVLVRAKLFRRGERGGEKSRAQLIESPVLTRIGIDGVTPGISPVDSFCKDHDIAYFDAQGQPDEAMKKLEADLVLMARLDQLDFDQLPAVERLYARLMSFVFFEKIICVDLPNASSEWMGSRILELAKSFERLFQKIDGLTYIDQFGTKMTGVALDGKVGGLAYQMYWVTDRQADGSSRMWSYYKDAFEEAHGVSSIINEEIIGESLKEIIVMRDGSVSEQVGDSEPITLITPGYHPAPELGAASNNPLASYKSGQLFSGRDSGRHKLVWVGEHTIPICPSRRLCRREGRMRMLRCLPRAQRYPRQLVPGQGISPRSSIRRAPGI